MRACLSHLFRESDVIARVGGDEFVVLMSGASEKKGRPLRLIALKTLYRHRMLQMHVIFNITFSVGLVATKANASVTLENLIEQADQRMYQSKKSASN
ncbi:diguanylate cyclase [Vibrio sinaloensis]|nr:diguanylate cyclase [Vibrio sinaloensis]